MMALITISNGIDNYIIAWVVDAHVPSKRRPSWPRSADVRSRLGSALASNPLEAAEKLLDRPHNVHIRTDVQIRGDVQNKVDTQARTDNHHGGMRSPFAGN